MLLLPPVCQQQGHTSNVTLATWKTAFAIGFNYQVSMSCSFYVDAERLTSAKAPYINPLIIGAYSSSNPSSSWSDKRRASTYAKLIAGRDGGGDGTNGIICRESHF